jgi:hypothetical protein
MVYRNEKNIAKQNFVKNAKYYTPLYPLSESDMNKLLEGPKFTYLTQLLYKD